MKQTGEKEIIGRQKCDAEPEKEMKKYMRDKEGMRTTI